MLIDSGLVEIKGEIIRVRRFGDDGYTVLHVIPDKDCLVEGENQWGNVTLVGNMPEFVEGMHIAAHGTPFEHQRFGLQYKIQEIQECGFVKEDALIDYLSSTAFKGIGRVNARKIVNTFGVDTLDVLDNEVERIREVEGLSESRYVSFIEQWQDKRAIHKVMTELMGYGLTMALAIKVHNHFKDATIEIIKDNPYRITEIQGVGFHKADDIALKMGMPRNSVNRVKAGIEYILDYVMYAAGHCYLNTSDVVDQTLELLKGDVGTGDIASAINELENAGKIVVENKRIYITHIHAAEVEVADRIKQMLKYSKKIHYPDIASLRADFDTYGINDIEFEPEQEEAIRTALNSPVCIITGGPGTGKSLGNSSFIPTVNGLSRMGDIKIGDYVFGSRGKPVKVLGVYPQGVKSVYKVNFDDHTHVEACLEHLWTIQNKRDRSKNTFHVYDTKTIIEKLKGGDRARRLYIPLAKPVEYPVAKLELDSYLLGLLLGDGSMIKSVGFSTLDNELIEYINNILPNNLVCKLKKNSQKDYTIANKDGRSRRGSNQIINALRAYGLMGHRAPDKFIPKEFLYSGLEQRMALLQGLMDTDGTVEKKSRTNTSYSTVSLQLARDVQFLAQSLGCKAVLRKKRGKYKGNAHYSYRVTIAPPDESIELFRLIRKKNIFKYHTKYKPIKMIKSVEYDHDEECTCIYVEAEDHLFCANNFTLTHNTTITKAVCNLFDVKKVYYELCAPTGRAAKRASEATGKSASTIHRMLGFKQGGFEYNSTNPLDTDCVIADESSMLDISLFRYLLDALEYDTRLILIGDADQLPSVGPGNVLHDLINSGVVPVVRLKTIFRQAKGSNIVTAAHQILQGEVPELLSPAKSKGRNCMMVASDDKDTLISYILSLVETHLPNAGYKHSDIQIITPMKEKGLGTKDLNPKLQALLNPPSDNKTEINTDFRILRVGDRVMHIRNDYNKEVFNGDLGVIASIDKSELSSSVIYVQYPDRDNLVEYEQCDWSDLQLAYACTVHKVQGSEYPCVILVLHPSQYVMLQRNLFYTGLTRAKKLCIIAGTSASIKTAVENNQIRARNTTLKERLAANTETYQ